MRRIDRQRRQQWKNMCEEMFFQPVAFCFLEITALYQHNIRCRKRRAQLEPTLLLVCGELRHRLSDARQLLGWSNPSGLCVRIPSRS